MNAHHALNYVEFAACDLQASKAFFTEVFGWHFDDYGPDYTAFSEAGLNGGFYRAERASRVADGAALLVLYSDSLEHSQQRVEQAGGVISTAIFAFPGGRRFHFIEPSGNELAVWSDR
ncbi:VOC family protein [Pokkaliibacter sp. MBI-7]|uniref:VOC family protein n=1 Tax=Pokkaliibacter sp. MBI-7 TaxID=3040600 RepID=UPI00244D132D|nr:VOC family protein [Pokkaliibacter sp. MBI-7]MDH2432607.1 VOC family protein [Pokkaliibacter sp. MBI-7]